MPITSEVPDYDRRPIKEGKHVKRTLDQQVRAAAAKVWRMSNPDDPVPDWLLNGG